MENWKDVVEILVTCIIVAFSATIGVALASMVIKMLVNLF